MRSFWSRTPLLRILFALMAGIALAFAFSDLNPVLWLMTGLLICAGISAIIMANLNEAAEIYRFRVFSGTSLTFLILSAGYLLAVLSIQKNYAGYFGNYSAPGCFLVARIDQPPVTRDKIMMVQAEVEQVKSAIHAIQTSGEIQLNLIKDSLSTKLDYGDVILLQAKIDSYEKPKNPSEFNYKRYQSFHYIYQQAFLNSGDWVKVDSERGNHLLAVIYKVRNSFLHLIEKYVHDKNDFGVASAIMLGYRDYVSGSLTRAFASSGTLHVLSVSGLHVAVMFIMLNFLLNWMDKLGRKFVVSKAAIIILFIWFYACITGLSPPVLRSAMMFSLIQSGRVFSRNVNIYNIIAGSAIALLLYDPCVLADVGFQLSYLAVIGIVYLQPKISPLVVIDLPKEPKFKEQKNLFYKAAVFLRYDVKWFIKWFADWCWQLIAVSIAAQIITMPLSLFYFFRFPNLFLISNLIVIPLSNFILFSGTALFAFGHVPHLNNIVGWIFNELLIILDKYIFWVNGLPFALTRAVSITALEMLMMYLLIILVCWLLEERRPRVLIASLLLVLGLCSFNSYRNARNSTRKEIVVYSIPKEKAIAFISGKKIWYDFDKTLWNDDNTMAFDVWHHWSDCRITNETPLQKDTGMYRSFEFGKLVVFEGKKILEIDSTFYEANNTGDKKLKIDLIILSGGAKVSIEHLKQAFDFNGLVFDSSVKSFKAKRWIADCERLSVKYWNVNERGAYIEDIQ